MKGLSIEEKARRYDEAIINGSRLWECDIITRESYEFIFPELRESDDERVKNALIKHFKECQKGADCDEIICGLTYYDILDWLEKQGKDDMGISESTKQELEDNLNKALEKETAESYNELLDGKESADKTEPKFKVGDWIVSNVSHEDYRICKILNIENGEYVIESIYGYQGHNKFETFDKDYHLWTIQDAKDGDILAEETCTFIIKKLNPDLSAEIYCCLFDDGDFELSSTLGFDDTSTYPAIKEQCALLFQKMKESGYDWDAEKKELKKIEQKQSFDIEIPFGAKDSELQEVTYYTPKGFHAEINGDKVVIKKGEKPITWSEENERTYKSVLYAFEHNYPLNSEQQKFIKSLKNIVPSQPKHEWSEEDKKILEIITTVLQVNFMPTERFSGYEEYMNVDLINWLISLRPRLQWKPSDEQIRVLDLAIRRGNIRGTIEERTLESLFNDLKKLKG